MRNGSRNSERTWSRLSGPTQWADTPERNRATHRKGKSTEHGMFHRMPVADRLADTHTGAPLPPKKKVGTFLHAFILCQINTVGLDVGNSSTNRSSDIMHFLPRLLKKTLQHEQLKKISTSFINKTVTCFRSRLSVSKISDIFGSPCIFSSSAKAYRDLYAVVDIIRTRIIQKTK